MDNQNNTINTNQPNSPQTFASEPLPPPPPMPGEEPAVQNKTTSQPVTGMDPVTPATNQPTFTVSEEGVYDSSQPTVQNETTHQSQKPKRKISKKMIMGVLGILVLVGGIGVGVTLTKQSQELRRKAAVGDQPNLLISNVSDTSISVWWRSEAKSPGCVTITGGGKSQELCSKNKQHTHLVNFNNLTPSNNYQIEVNSKNEIIIPSEFYGTSVWTKNTPTLRKPERIVSGKIIDTNEKGVVSTTVFVYPNLSDRHYYSSSAQTSESGEYQIDLSILDQQVENIQSFFIKVIRGDGIVVAEEIVQLDSTNNIPPITIADI